MIRTMKTWLWTLAIASLATLPARGETLEEAEAALSAAYDKHRSIVANMGMSGSMAPMNVDAHMTGKGRYEMLHKDGKDLIRVEASSKTVFGRSDGAETVESHSLSVSDGVKCMNFIDQAGRKVVQPTGPELAQRLGGKAGFESIRKGHDIKLLPDDTIEGKPACVMEATLTEVNNNDPRRTRRLYFDRGLGIMVKMVTLSPTGDIIDVMTITDIKTDVDIDAARFVFQAPPDATVFDEQGQIVSTPPPAPGAGPAVAAPPAPAPAAASPSPKP